MPGSDRGGTSSDAAYGLTGGAEKGLYVQFAMAMGNLRAVANKADLLAGDARALELAVELVELGSQLREGLETGTDSEA
jgi:hypothetical protein